MWVIHLEWVDQFKSEIMDFDWVVILDFWAEWCGPCRMLWPVMEELATDNEWKNVKIVKVDVEWPGNEELVQKFQVSSIPAVFVMKAWNVIKPVIWVNPEEVYQAEIDALLAANTEQVANTVKMDNSADDLQMAA
jgi:thioredoxin 1